MPAHSSLTFYLWELSEQVETATRLYGVVPFILILAAVVLCTAQTIVLGTTR
jgi:hypothetical protein